MLFFGTRVIFGEVQMLLPSCGKNKVGEVQVSVFLTGAGFGEFEVSLFVAGAGFGEIWNDSRSTKMMSYSIKNARGRRKK